MRFLAAFALFATIGCAAAQPRESYDLYISEPGSGPELYAFAGQGRAAVVEVHGCGDARLLPNADAILATLRARAAQHDVTRISVGPGSNTQIGMCDAGDNDKDHDDEADSDGDTIVIVESLSPSQLRRMIGTFRAAPEPVRNDLQTALGL